jgi:hypothetical protein
MKPKFLADLLGVGSLNMLDDQICTSPENGEDQQGVPKKQLPEQ